MTDLHAVARMTLVAGALTTAAACAQVATAPVAPSPLTATGRTAIEAAFARADVNGDGRLSRDEAVHLPEIAARFDEFDLNRDGWLSFAEFAIAATAAAK